MKPDDYVFEGSDNVFADIGLPDAEERLRKAPLGHAIGSAIREQGLTQVEAAERMGVTQPEVSRIVRGRVTGFTFERLLRCLVALGRDVDITIRNSPRQSESGELRIRTVARRARTARAPARRRFQPARAGVSGSRRLRR